MREEVKIETLRVVTPSKPKIVQGDNRQKHRVVSLCSYFNKTNMEHLYKVRVKTLVDNQVFQVYAESKNV
ncbi:hypothetical protein GGR06_001666 [Bacteroides reticulotermitis]|uniref:Uncharacterized protein n=1 Tax=Bacteroides reticulotermitis TaxID=1133319 RepID=A0A840CVG8_9BACE|nr:hypothetical protein [Bacteroides reticulotermitis]